MSIGLILLIVSGVIPLGRAIWANLRTTLLHALIWGLAAWGAWLWLAVTGSGLAGYVSTCLTACAGVAVLGARRPGVGAWNAVVAGLLATLLIPLVQDFLTGNSWLNDELWYLFLIAVLGVGLLNYAATRFALGALGLVFACAAVLFAGFGNSRFYLARAVFLTGLAPWVVWGWLVLRNRSPDEGTQLWRDFRNRFGLMWALRVQDQFNLAAMNRNLPLILTWNNLIRMDGSRPDAQESAAGREILTALLKRFGLP